MPSHQENFGIAVAEALSAGVPVLISKPVSYQSVSYLLASLLKENPFKTGTYLSENIITNIPETAFVSENESAIIIKMEAGYFLHDKQKGWVRLSDTSIKP